MWPLRTSTKSLSQCLLCARACVSMNLLPSHSQVKLSVFFDYARSLTWYMALLILLFNVLSSGLSVGSNFWLAAWSDREGSGANISGAETYA